MSDIQHNPYPGPRPYQADEWEIFAGRDHETSELSSLIMSHQAVLLYAQSGAGKSSLLNAGIIPTIPTLKRKGVSALPVSRVGMPIPREVRPQQVANVYTFSAIGDLFPDVAENGAWFSRATLGDALNRLPHEADDAGEPVIRFLAFDQFEELFSTHPDQWPDRRVFVEQVSAALERDRMLRVLFIVREDYLAAFVEMADLLPERARTKYHLDRLREPEALAAVTRPLQNSLWTFDEGVAETLVQDLLAITVETTAGETTTVKGEFIEPVQLQVVCSALLQRLPVGKTRITIDDLRAFGRPDEALQLFYETAIEAVVTMGSEEDFVRSWFETHLITPTGTRGLVFKGTERTGGLANNIVAALEARHLIRPEIRSGSRWYELTHDRFIRPIQASNQQWKDRVGWLKTVLRKSSDLRQSDLEAPEQFRKQERLAVITEELASDESRVAIRREMDDLARRYEQKRASMPPSRERTIAMNEIMAHMRTLARACVSFWDDYANSESPGRRLAAIAIIQMSPNVDKLSWLQKRFSVEKPFLFYHSALALQKIAEEFGSVKGAEIRETVSKALNQVLSVKDVAPDRNTVRVLKDILASGLV
jgi:hypothetical protein